MMNTNNGIGIGCCCVYLDRMMSTGRQDRTFILPQKHDLTLQVPGTLNRAVCRHILFNGALF